jgi:hypothetical protein
MSSSALTPLPESATASSRCTGLGGSPGTIPTRRRVHTAAGPGVLQSPRAKRHSTAPR